MAQTESECGLLRLYYGGTWTETAMEFVEMVLSRPELIRVPGAPDRLEGVLYRKGKLIPVFRPGGAEGKTEGDSPACVVVIRGEADKIYGVAADEVAGGSSFDSVYR